MKKHTTPTPSTLRDNSNKLMMMAMDRRLCNKTKRLIEDSAITLNKTADGMDGKWIISPRHTIWALVVGGLLFAGMVYVLMNLIRIYL